MLFEIYIWIACFISIYVCVFWLIVLGYGYRKKNKVMKEFPLVSFGVPVFNEAGTIIATLESLLGLDYPNIEIIIVNDGSSDDTKKIVSEFIRLRKLKNVFLINQKNSGKGATLNTAIRKASGKYFAVFDADCVADKDALKLMIPCFSDSVGAVIAGINLRKPKSVIAKMQRIEYVSASFMRSLMSNIGTLHITHGALSVFDVEILRKVGGFDEDNLTEDFEVAMRLRSKGFQIKFCEGVFTETKVPESFKSLWRQRVRWFRGFMRNNIKYRSFILNKKYGLLGRFQIPLELLMLALVFVSMSLMAYHIWNYIGNAVFRLVNLGWDSFIFSFDFDGILYGFNFKIFFPIAVTFALGLYLYIMAHKYLGQKWKFYFPTIIYLFLYPMIRSLQWFAALMLEIFGARKRWR